MKKNIKRLGNFLFYLVTLSLIGCSLFYWLSAGNNGAFFGYRLYGVLTESMTPVTGKEKQAFSAGDLLVVQRTAYEDLAVGDVITYQLDDSENFLTHRIIEKLANYNQQAGPFLVTQGDRNNSADAPVAYAQVMGRVVLVMPKMGRVLLFLRKHGLSCVFLFVVMALLVKIFQRKSGADKAEKDSSGIVRKDEFKEDLKNEDQKR